jgi:hypothetical protein
MIFRKYSGALHLKYTNGEFFYKYGGALHQRQLTNYNKGAEHTGICRNIN